MIKQSSLDAYEHTQKFNADAASRKVILDFMRESKSPDFTRGELALALNIPINRITPRVVELIAMGEIEELARRKSDISHVACHALRLVVKEVEAA